MYARNLLAMKGSKRACLAEVIGTFGMVFLGTGAMVLDLPHGLIALTFGGAVCAMICVFGRASGAHINPAVTLSLWLAGRVEKSIVVPYVVSQCAGALMASGLLALIANRSSALGATVPRGSWVEAFTVELLLTAVLAFVILSVTLRQRMPLVAVAVVVGSTVGMASYFFGPVSGASMNPARSLGPAVFSDQMRCLWIYLVACCLGGLLAIPTCRMVHEPGCCRPPRSG